MIKRGRFHLIVAMSLAWQFVVRPCLAQISCEIRNERAGARAAAFYPRRSYIVQGKGRLYLYTASDRNCRSKDIFVVVGDSLVAYSVHQGWYLVMYTNPKTGATYEGWVRPERLKYQGTLGPRGN